jgi:hypothetical protein
MSNTPSPSPDTDPTATYRYDREVLFNRANSAIFALETTLPLGGEERRSLFRVRIALNDTWKDMKPEVKAASFGG